MSRIKLLCDSFERSDARIKLRVVQLVPENRERGRDILTPMETALLQNEAKSTKVRGEKYTLEW
jgi:hypothetical protein